MKTKSNHKRMDEVRNMLDFKGCFMVDCVDRSGGLCLLWNDEMEISASLTLVIILMLRLVGRMGV